MFIDVVDEIHMTTVHTSGSGDVLFPDWNGSEWKEEIIERIESDEGNEYATTYSIWMKS
jgi:hypothetical protein